MSTLTEVAAAHHETEVGEEARVRRNRLGLWIFFFSEIFLFGAIFASRFYLWGGTRPDLDQFVGLIATAVLLISSFFMARAETAVAHGDRSEFLRDLLITAFLGTLFLIGVVGIEWQGHLRPSDGVFGAIFFGMTGLHALHVVSGVFLILVVWWNGRKGAYTPEKHWPVEATAIYWHYVDVVWVFFYPALYLIGKAV
jgi:cytochrome c oxidase subunit III